MNIDIPQNNQNVNFDAGVPDGGDPVNKGIFGWSVNKIMNQLVNKAKKNAVNTANQLALLRYLMREFSWLAQLFNSIGPISATTNPQDLAQKLEKLGSYLNYLIQEAKQLPPSLRKKLNGFIKQIGKSIGTTIGGGYQNPLGEYLHAILNGNGDLTQQEIDSYATKYAKKTLIPPDGFSAAEWFFDLNSTINKGASAVSGVISSLSTLSQVIEARLTWDMNVIQELLNAASKLVDKQFKVELQMQGRIKG